MSVATAEAQAERVAKREAEDLARLGELRSWFQRARARADIVYEEYAQACGEANRIEAAISALEYRIAGGLSQ